MRKLRIIVLLITLVLSLSAMVFATGLEDALPLEATPYPGDIASASTESHLLDISEPTIYLDNNYYDLTIRQGTDLPLRFSCIGGGSNLGYITITDMDGNIVGDLVRYVNLPGLQDGLLYSVAWDAETASLPVGQYWVMSFIVNQKGELADPENFDAVLLNVVSASKPLKSVSFFDAEEYTYDDDSLHPLTKVTLCPEEYHFYGILYNPTDTTTERPVVYSSSNEAVAEVFSYSGYAYVSAKAPGTATITVSAGNDVTASLEVTVGHNCIGEVTLEPNCSQEGLATYSCSCGYSYTESIPADKESGHDIDTMAVLTAPTACKPGQGYGLCSICGYSVICTIPSIFTDVMSDGYYVNAIDYFYENNIVKGMSDTTFGLDTSLTRGMLVTLLYRIEGQPTCKAGTPFTDVEPNQYYTTAIAWAYKNEIAKGITSTTFEPNIPVTRQQLATFIYRYAKYKNVDVTGAADLDIYPDGAQVTDFAIDPVAWAVDAGIINGIVQLDGTYLTPHGDATRPQAVTMLYRYIGFAAENPAPEPPEDPEDSIMVWITPTSARYHTNSHCSGIENASQIPLSYAKSVGYIPCSICVK